MAFPMANRTKDYRTGVAEGTVCLKTRVMWYYICLRFICKPVLMPVANWANLVLATQNCEVF